MAWKEDKKKALQAAKRLERKEKDEESVEELQHEDQEFMHEADELQGMLNAQKKKRQ